MTALRTVDEAAPLLGVSVSTVYRLAEHKEIAFVDLSSRVDTGKPRGRRPKPVIRFTDQQLQEFIAKRTVAAAAPAAVEESTQAAEQPRRRASGGGRVLSMKGADRYV